MSGAAGGVAAAVCAVGAGVAAGTDGVEGADVGAGVSWAATASVVARKTAVSAREERVIGDLQETHTYCASGMRGCGYKSKRRNWGLDRRRGGG